MNPEDTLKPDRAVRVLAGSFVGAVGRVTGWVSGVDKWEIDLGHTVCLMDADQMESLFSMSQIVVEVEEDTQPALVKKVIPFGMDSDDLAHEAAEFIADCVARIKGVGNDQYSSNGFQKFETLELDELFQYTLEEVQDIANYCAFLAIRIQRLRSALDDRDDLGRGTEEEYEAGDVTTEDFEEGQ